VDQEYFCMVSRQLFWYLAKTRTPLRSWNTGPGLGLSGSLKFTRKTIQFWSKTLWLKLKIRRSLHCRNPSNKVPTVSQPAKKHPLKTHQKSRFKNEKYNFLTRCFRFKICFIAHLGVNLIMRL
jgi:hypothetical protein